VRSSTARAGAIAPASFCAMLAGNPFAGAKGDNGEMAETPFSATFSGPI
jgi:hypothetical protein